MHATVTVATLSAGDPGQTLFVAEDKGYRIQLDYKYEVPFGNDPLFDFNYQVTVSNTEILPTPHVPVAIALLLLVCGGWMLVARRASGGV